MVGGGQIAERKAASLLEAGAAVRVIGPALTDFLSFWKSRGEIEHVDEHYDARYLEDAFLAIAATDDRAVNERVSADCRAKGILVNVVDAPDQCDFFVPSMIRRGDLTLAVSTDGKSPALAKRIREELEELYGEEYESFLAILAEMRSHVAVVCAQAGRRHEILTNLAQSDIPTLLREGRQREVVERLRKSLVESGLPVPERWMAIDRLGGNGTGDG